MGHGMMQPTRLQDVVLKSSKQGIEATELTGSGGESLATVFLEIEIEDFDNTA